METYSNVPFTTDRTKSQSQTQSLRLPPDLHALLSQYLRQSDQGSYFQVSKDIYGPIVGALRKLHVTTDYDTKDDGAFVGLVRSAINLEQLGIQGIPCWEGGASLTEALCKDHAGRHLRSLSLPWAPAHRTVELLRHIGRGGLPCLRELDLGNLSLSHTHTLPATQTSHPDCPISTEIVKAIESRRDRGLPPLTQLQGVDALHHDHLRRLLACCPAHTVAHLEAVHYDQLQVLTEYIRASDSLPALHSVTLVGNDKRAALPYNYASSRLVGDVLEAVVALRPLTLQRLEIQRAWAVTGGPMAQLATAIGKGLLPGLTSVALIETAMRPTVFVNFVHGLLTSPTCLHTLRLDRVWCPSPAVAVVAGAIAAGGGLGALRDVHLDLQGQCWDPILETLGSGRAPCARILEKLRVHSHTTISDDGVRKLLRGLANGVFPVLTALTLHVADIGQRMDLAGDVASALRTQHAHGTTSRLQQLVLKHHSITLSCLDAFTPLFRDGALPCLTVLDARHWGRYDSNAQKDGAQAPAWIGDWTQLGTRIKLRTLVIVTVIANSVKHSLCNILLHPDFCPFLRKLSWLPSRMPVDVRTILKTGRHRHLDGGDGGAATPPSQSTLRPLTEWMVVKADADLDVAEALKDEAMALVATRMEHAEVAAAVGAAMAEVVVAEGAAAN
jgi:hypothetical protein